MWITLFINNDNNNILFYQTSVRLFYAQTVQIQNTNICSPLGNLGKNRRFESGGSKNQNKCSIFPSAYKLDYLHTNLILKHSKKSLKINTFRKFSSKIKYRISYR